ncbi:SNARE associated Golgi protein family [Hibiscus syriacus]|uniref:SNARE associated Golgi protein family n=1 Tax=Hibiscus syriacus TaxID=106335 RepID=A0A6A3CYN9_HIBSY|nr:SNARE associated Golgi protein family [Hibiscus syriacus]
MGVCAEHLRSRVLIKGKALKHGTMLTISEIPAKLLHLIFIFTRNKDQVFMNPMVPITTQFFGQPTTIIELPQLDSPPAITVSPSLAEKEVIFHCDEEKRNNSSSQIQIIDWKNFDNLLNSPLTYTTSYPFQSTAALITQNDELEAQEQHHLLGCFPES